MAAGFGRVAVHSTIAAILKAWIIGSLVRIAGATIAFL
jgi:hypothetical protein